MDRIDLTGVKVIVLGNNKDEHLFRLSNPVDQSIIEPNGEYEAEFVSKLGKQETIQLNTSEVSSGILIIPITISNGIYKIRRLNPRKTIITIEIQAQ